jgi:hypothetical protein
MAVLFQCRTKNAAHKPIGTSHENPHSLVHQP